MGYGGGQEKFGDLIVPYRGGTCVLTGIEINQRESYSRGVNSPLLRKVTAAGG